MTTAFPLPGLQLGVCYYPEHWDRSLWRDDLQRMKAAGIRVIRVGEFAWSKFEPTEGVFTYDFFDDFLALCKDEGMQVIFGTPTATPPAWLTEKYPECLNAFMDGTLMRHGSRRHYNYNAPRYQELCARIVEKIARRYGQHPAIVGWQIDNEFNCEANEFYAEADSEAFRLFLRDRYGSLDALNQAWGTVFWNQEYTDWQQVYVPRPTPTGAHNPHQELDYRRFIADSVNAFCRMQAEILRRHVDRRMFITTNGMFGHIDNHRMTEECLDTYTYDSYPNFGFPLDGSFHPDSLNDRKWSRNLTEVRSICPHFGIMEQQSGPNGWVNRMEGPAPRPGQMTLWAMQSIAHGADYVSFFRWRTCTFGTEMYWHGILDYDNRDNRRLAEVRRIHAMTEKLQLVAGADSAAAFALVRDYDNQWDAEIDAWHRRVLAPSEKAVFETAQRTHTPYDMLFLRENTTVEQLLRYPVLIAPHQVMLTQAQADLLTVYAERGGTLIVGCRTGQKDGRGHCVMEPMPGTLSAATGTQVKDFTFLSPAEDPITADWDGKPLDMPVFNDVLEALPGATVLARYASGYYKGEAALVENRVGRGRVLHLGACFSRENLTRLLAYVGCLSPWSDTVSLPEGVELTVREKDGVRYLFLLNYMAQPQEIVFHRPAVSLLTGNKLEGTVTLEAYQAEVVRLV